MNHTFGNHLERFAHAVDIVSDNVFFNALELVRRYLRDTLSIQYCELLVPIPIDGRPGLKSEWHPGGEGWASSIRNESGDYNGQISYAFDKQRRAWMVAVDRNELRDTACEDLWNSGIPSEKIPAFVHLNDKPIKTSIMCPLRADEQRLGILNFESTIHLRPTKTLTEEIRRITDSIAYLLILKKAHQFQCESTGKALGVLDQSTRLPLTDKDRVFVASSGKGDAVVTGIITRTLAEFDVEVAYWKVDTHIGNIQDYLWNKISTSVLGVCYLSEPNERSSFRYTDNRNVLFEAGMMHALSKSGEVMKGWIPIREKDSPPLPFDFGSEKIVEVPRNSNFEINEDWLQATLRSHLKSANLPHSGTH